MIQFSSFCVILSRTQDVARAGFVEKASPCEVKPWKSQIPAVCLCRRTDHRTPKSSEGEDERHGIVSLSRGQSAAAGL